MRLPSQLLRCRRGGVAVIGAISGGFLCALAALTVDVGSIALAGRRLQGAADLAALSAARDLEHAQAAASATAIDNLGPGVSTTTVLGAYVADPKRRPADRFTAGAFPSNAARVSLTRATPLFFGRVVLGKDNLTLTRTGTAATAVEPPRAMFSIGSRLARLDGGVANQVLSGLTGSTVSLSLMDYRALAATQVNLLTFSDALATELGVTAGDYDSLLKRKVDAGRLLKVIERLAGDQSDSALSRLSAASIGVDVELDRLIGLDAEAPQGIGGGLDATVSALDLVTAMLEVGAGDRQVKLDLSVPAGVASLKTSLAIGDRPQNSPWLTVTKTGTPIIRTAQTRLYVQVKTAQKLSGLAQVELPILIELASSEARLDAIACEPRAVTVGVRPGVAKAFIGQIDEARLNDFGQSLGPKPATLLSVLGLVSVTGEAAIEVADRGFKAARFSDADIRAQATRTVTSSSLAQGLVASLISGLDIQVKAVGLGLGLGGLTQALGVLLTPLAPVLDAVIAPVLDTLGLKIGEADVTVHGASCPKAGGRAVLVG